VFGEEFVIYARLVIKTVEVSRRNQLDEIPVTFVVLAEQYQMIRALGVGTAVLVVIRRNVDFAANDRLHAVRYGLMIKSGRGEQISVVGDGYGWHPAPRRLGSQFADFARAVEKRVIRVQMQVYKVRGGHAEAILNQRREIGNRQFKNPKQICRGTRDLFVR
jgi:hypothetical protein